MLVSQIEEWVLRVIESVESNSPSEDARVELKREWPGHQKAARQIAGHANAARGEDILWIIGVDEEDGVIGVANEELSNWKSQVESNFDGIAPSMTPVVIQYNGKTLVALLFDTTRIPFVVKNPLYGTPNSGSISHEVPWREGNSTRSARHSDLIKLLVPVSLLPDFEILRGELSLTVDEKKKAYNWKLNILTYVIPKNKDQVVFPEHRLKVSAAIPGFPEHERAIFRLPGFTAPDWKSGHPDYTVSAKPLITTNPSSAIIDGPGRLEIYASLQTPLINFSSPQKIDVTIALSPARSTKTQTIDITLSYKGITSKKAGNDFENFTETWCLGKTNE